MPSALANLDARRCSRAGRRFHVRQLATAVRPTPKARAALAVPPMAATNSRTFMLAIINLRAEASSPLTRARRVK